MQNPRIEGFDFLDVRKNHGFLPEAACRHKVTPFQHIFVLNLLIPTPQNAKYAGLGAGRCHCRLSARPRVHLPAHSPARRPKSHYETIKQRLPVKMKLTFEAVIKSAASAVSLGLQGA